MMDIERAKVLLLDAFESRDQIVSELYVQIYTYYIHTYIYTYIKKIYKLTLIIYIPTIILKYKYKQFYYHVLILKCIK